MELDISLQFTPNPNTLKYVVNKRLLVTGAENYTTEEDAQAYSPLAAKLFALPGIGGVMIGPNFVTITLTVTESLRELNSQVTELIRGHLESGEEICRPRSHAAPEDEDDTSRRIREIIDSEIRPAVAIDGGDITFEGYRDGVVYLFMLGACAGCPSATMTLKMGIEERLKKEFPEIVSIEPVNS